MAITAAHYALLTSSAITPEVIESSGIISNARGLAFPWCDGTGPTVWQFRPDTPSLDEDGKPMKYVFPKGTQVPMNRLRDGEDYSRLIIVEGTKQQYAVLSHAPRDFAVYGMSGCRGYAKADLSIAQDREVWLLLDADLETNPDVWTAAEDVTKNLRRQGATKVHYVLLPGHGKEGVDDVLAKLPEDKRAESLRRWLAQAEPKLPKRPKAKRPKLSEVDEGAVKFFRKVEGRMMFQPMDAAMSILEKAPAAITNEKTIALYRNGVYEVNESILLSLVVKTLGNFYTPGHLTNITHVMRGILADEGKTLPERMTDPFLNCPNGMVDLRTGTLVPHDPSYMSYVQVTVPYEKDTATPTYDAWLREALRRPHHTDEDIDALVDDIEETAGTMLDPSRTPSKALFLFGPSRSGKSTFLRLLKAIAGAANTSAVTLHSLATDTFAAANMYGKMLNVAADLSNAHVSDLSMFKMLSGEDVVQANRKYGNQFEFTNQCLIAFSANELPTVSEASRAYAERMKPFEFPNSFAGREDKTLETKLMEELPGILARWVRAYGRYLARGGYRATDRQTQDLFEAGSDRVVQFFQEQCTLTPAQYGQSVPENMGTARRDAYAAFKEWADRNGSATMGERAFLKRLMSVPGVTDVRMGETKRKVLNLTIARGDAPDMWDNEPAPREADPVADPIEPSGVELPSLPAQAASATASETINPCPVPEVTSAVSEPQAPAETIAVPKSMSRFLAVRAERNR